MSLGNVFGFVTRLLDDHGHSGSELPADLGSTVRLLEGESLPVRDKKDLRELGSPLALLQHCRARFVVELLR